MPNASPFRPYSNPILDMMAWELLDGSNIVFRRHSGFFIAKHEKNGKSAYTKVWPSSYSFEDFQKEVILNTGMLAYRADPNSRMEEAA